MDFLRVWVLGYTNPLRAARELKGKPAPQWGFYAQFVRALMDSLLLYLPLSLIGHQPSTPSSLTFIPTARYYQASILLAPLFLLGSWLLLAAFTHLTLRLARLPSDMDQILNITGMTALIVGAFLVLWDWIWICLGWHNIVLLGLSHVVIDAWGVAITVAAYKHILGIPIWIGLLLNVVMLGMAIPLAATFMRGPF